MLSGKRDFLCIMQ